MDHHAVSREHLLQGHSFVYNADRRSILLDLIDSNWHALIMMECIILTQKYCVSVMMLILHCASAISESSVSERNHVFSRIIE